MLNAPSPAQVCAAIMRSHLALWLGLCCCVPGLVRAEPGARQPQPEDLLPESNLDIDDPIGVDAESRSLEREANERARANKPPPPAQVTAERARFGPLPPPVDARKGEVLTAAPTTREIAHAPGQTRAGLGQRADRNAVREPLAKPSELRYRVAVPEGSELSALEVCNASGCRPGLPDANHAALGAYERRCSRAARRPNADCRSRARCECATRAAQRSSCTRHRWFEGAALRVRLTYVSDLPLHGGVARLVYRRAAWIRKPRRAS